MNKIFLMRFLHTAGEKSMHTFNGFLGNQEFDWLLGNLFEFVILVETNGKKVTFKTNTLVIMNLIIRIEK